MQTPRAHRLHSKAVKKGETISARSPIIKYSRTQWKNTASCFLYGQLRQWLWTLLLYETGIIINVAFTSLQPICCWSAGVERFMGRDARTENFALKGGRRGKRSILASSLPRAGSWDSIGAATGSCGCECWQASAPCGSLDKHCFLLTVTHGHTHANTHLLANFYKQQIYRGVWMAVQLFNTKKFNHLRLSQLDSILHLSDLGIT